MSGGTLHKRHYLETPEKKNLFLETLFQQGRRFGWELEAWAVLSNHYHFVAQAPEDAKTLKRLMQAIHSITARDFNRIDHSPGRRGWRQYWDTCITTEASYYARLKYVHENPAKHGLVEDAANYRWRSMRWLLEQGYEYASPILAAKTDRVTVYDYF